MNIAIAISLGIMYGMAINTLKYFFASSMKSQIRQIKIICLSFLFSQLVRSGFEVYDNIRRKWQLDRGEYPKQFEVDMETMVTFILFIDGPILLILTLHHMNSLKKIVQKETARSPNHIE